jgi:tetratricopeptide (TPR) repeat protein
MIPEQEIYSQATAALQAEDLAKARELFSQLLKIDRKNVNYWLWMSAAVETTKERIYCLREALLLDPENQEAILGLRMLGERVPESTATPPADPPIVPWKTSLELADEHPAIQNGLGSRIAVYALLGIVVIALFGYGIYRAFTPPHPTNNSPIMHWTVTPLPSATTTLTPSITPTGPVALSIALDATLTPTPIYVATPHNRLEAYNAGMRAYQKGNWTEAADYFQQVLASESNDADVYYHLGDVYRFENKYANALSAYQKAIKIDAAFAPAYLGVAQIDLYGSPLKTDDALTELEKAISLDPQLAQAYLELAKVSLAQNDPDAALGWVEKLDTSMAGNAQVDLIRAQAYLAKGNIDQALTTIQLANQEDRSLVAVYGIWGQVLQANGDYAESMQPLLTVLANSPSDSNAQILLARAYFETGNSDKAFALVNTGLQANSKSIEAYLLRADLYLASGDSDSARADYNSILHIDYNNFDANLGIGRVYLAETLAGAAYNAFDYTDKFAKTDAQKATVEYWRGMALLGLGEPTAAMKKFGSALNDYGYVLPYNLREDAQNQLAKLYTPTPTLNPTETKTVTETPFTMSSSTQLPSVTP